MSKQEFIYKVTFIEPHRRGLNWVSEFYFTSLAAIYDSFSPEQIGCKVERLWNSKIKPGEPYKGRKCTIAKEPIKRKRQNKPI